MNALSRGQSAPTTGFFRTVRELLELVKIEHTLFALPLALAGMLMAQRGLPSARVIVLVAIAFTAARTVAMAFNRVADRRYDAINPRTSSRAIPIGRVSPSAAMALVLITGAIFLAASWSLNRLCFYLSPVALTFLVGYSYTKRFTWTCHIFLGLCLGMAPLAGWLAVTGAWAWAPAILSLGVVFWVAGFDIIYACQDFEFDRQTGLHSIPVKFSPKWALRVAALSHILAYSLFLVAGFAASLSWPFYLLSAITAALLIWEHVLVEPDDLSRIDTAFFTVNSMVSFSLLVAVIGGLI